MKILRKKTTPVPVRHPRPRIAFKTLGCKANRAESDLLSEKLEMAGHKIVDSYGWPDIYIVNTCSVTNEADKKSRQAIRALKRSCSKARIFVFGCGVLAHRDFYKSMPEVDFAAAEPSEILKKIRGGRGCWRGTGVNLNVNRTRAVIKIQDGCNNSCSYCIVRILRGREKSYPMKEILKRINQKVSEGYKEIVLTGINITSWRGTGVLERDGGVNDFTDLIRMILDNTAVNRLRISSIEPESVNRKFSLLLREQRLCPHIHLPLQSGSNKILELMRRKYDTKKFAAACRLIKSFSPDAAITTDIIVGFPNETEKDFQETVRLCEKIEFAKIHVFPYSPRRGTPASVMPDQIDVKIKARRAKILRNLSDKLRLKFIKARLGKIYEVLFEERKRGAADNVWSGLTPNYIKVNVNSRSLNANIIKKIKLLRQTKNTDVIGKII
ncbi:MiaB/RimO family radical SAM methylthiotransferase [Candidatus Peregrinibacteria bacterium]|nr:MiaB/RimO family radical SAM methylthiotransferase [Candidatus Peregrinibacteria bacterium]